jgi:hypothetical protein
MFLPPLNRLRKSVVFFSFVFLCFIVSRLFFFKTEDEFVLPEEEIQRVYTEMCLLVASSGPMNIDTVFNLSNSVNKIFAYSFLPTDFDISDTIWHIWYYGPDIVKKTACHAENSACFSSILADSLQKGNWSVDTRRGNILLNVKQFRIEKKY